MVQVGACLVSLRHLLAELCRRRRAAHQSFCTILCVQGQPGGNFCRCRRPKPAARPRAWHPPTSEPQMCRTCRHELAASHFAIASQNTAGRNTQCRACCAEPEARRMAALPMPRVPQTKECLLCREELPAASFDMQRGGVDGLHSYCRKCGMERTAARRKERLPSQLPPPASIVCAACRKEKPFSGFHKLQGTVFGVTVMCCECAAARRSERRRAAKLQQAAASSSSNSGGSAEAAGGGLVSNDEQAAAAAPATGGGEAAGSK